jgi:hypothetical protein
MIRCRAVVMIQPAGLGGYFDIAERPHQYRDGAPVLLAEGALDLGLVGVDLHRQDQPSGFS